MKGNDDTQPSPAENAGQSDEGPPTVQDPTTPSRPAAEGPATDGGSEAGPPTPPGGSEPPPPGGYGPPSPAGGYARPPRLTRRRDDRVIAGVAGGIADYFGIDPLLVRLVFAGFTLLGGGGIVLYVLGWIFIPERGVGETSGMAPRVDAAKYLGIGLIAVATLILIDGIGFGPDGLGPLEHLFFATILVGLGVFLLRKESAPAQGPLHPPPHRAPPYAPTSGDATTSRMVVTEQAEPVGTAIYPATPTNYEPAGARRKKRERSRLGLLTLAAVLLATGTAAVLNNIGLTSFDGGQLSALALTVLGGGLIVGAWWGRARWLILIGILMFPFVTLLGLIDLSMVSMDGEVGTLNELPQNQIEIAGGYEVLAGEALIDMAHFEFSPDERAELMVDMAVGQVIITVPRNVYVEADVSLEAGEIIFFDNQRTGQGVGIADRDGDPESDARLSLDIDGALGQIEIERSSSRALLENQVLDRASNPKKPERRERRGPR